MLRKSVLLCLILLATVPALAQPKAPPVHDAEKEKYIREIIRVTGSEKVMQQMIDQMFFLYRQQMPQVSGDTWQRFRKKLDSRELIDLIVPIYDKYYTKDDLQKLLAFYRSPLGRKLIAVTPQVTRETMLVGQRWGREKGDMMNRDLQIELARQKSSHPTVVKDKGEPEKTKKGG